MAKYFLIIIIGYLFGCLQWSYILSKTLKKQDIRKLGMGNAGASNTVTVFGWKMGVTVGLLDILKAIISILLVKYLFKETNIFNLYLNGTSVILGHNFPFFMGFRGGKGTASNLGMLFAINLKLGILGLLVILTVTLITDYIVLGTMALVSFFILATIYFKYGTGSLILAIFIALLSVYKHLPNLERIYRKEEIGLRSVLKKKRK